MSNILNFSIVDSGQIVPQLYTTSLNADGVYDCYIKFRLLMTTSLNEQTVRNVIKNIKITETSTRYDFYSGLENVDPSTIVGRTVSEIFTFYNNQTTKYYYVDLFHYFKTNTTRNITFTYNISYSYDMLDFLSSRNVGLGVLSNCIGNIRNEQQTLPLSVRANNTFVLPSVINDKFDDIPVSIKDITISYANEQERLLKTKVLQKKLSQEEVKKYFSNMFFARDASRRTVDAFFIFDMEQFAIDNSAIKNINNFTNFPEVSISANVTTLDNSDNILDKNLKYKEIKRITFSDTNIFVINDILDQKELYTFGTNTTVEIKIKLVNQIQDEIKSDYTNINELKTVADSLRDYVAINYDSNYDFYNNISQDLVQKIKEVNAVFYSNAIFENILFKYIFANETKEFCKDYKNNIFGLLGLTDSGFTKKPVPEDFKLFCDIIGVIANEVKRIYNSISDYVYFYDYRFNEIYEHKTPINTGVMVINKRDIDATYIEEARKINNFISLFPQYYGVQSTSNNLTTPTTPTLYNTGIFISPRTHYLNGRVKRWTTNAEQKDFSLSEITLKSQLTKVRKENIGFYSDATQPYSRESILVSTNQDQLPPRLVSELNKVARYKKVNEEQEAKIYFSRDNVVAPPQLNNINDIKDSSRAYFESYTQLYFSSIYFVERLEKDGWRKIQIVRNQNTGKLQFNNTEGFFRLTRFFDTNLYPYNISEDINYPVYDQYFILPSQGYYSPKEYEFVDEPENLPEFSKLPVPKKTPPVASLPKIGNRLSPTFTKGELPEKSAEEVATEPPATTEPVQKTPTQETEETPPKEIPPEPEPVIQPITFCKYVGKNPYYIVILSQDGSLVGYFLTIEEVRSRYTFKEVQEVYAVSNQNDTTLNDEKSLSSALNCEIVKRPAKEPTYPDVSKCNKDARIDGYIVKTAKGYYLYLTLADVYAKHSAGEVLGITAATIGYNINKQYFTEASQSALEAAFSCIRV